MIPAFNGDGNLPPGRHVCSLTDVQKVLVEAPQFEEASATRRELFAGLVRYLAEWESAQEVLMASRSLLRAIWIGGSFASAELNPNDIDVSPIIDAQYVDTFAGRPGYKRVGSLTRHRPTLRERYKLDVFPIKWHPVVNILNSATWDNEDEAYVTDRGRFDDFWQRCRFNGSDIPTEESCESRRGYLEVHL